MAKHTILLTAALFLVSLAIIALVLLSVKNQQILQSNAASNLLKFENSDPKFSYSKSTNPNPRIFGISQWNENPSGDKYQYRGGTAHQSPASGDPNSFNGVATFDLSSSGLKFDKFKFGYMKAPNRGISEVFVDGQLLKAVNQRGEIAPGTYESESLSCGPHKIEIKVTDKTPDHKNYITVDYIDIQTCASENPTTTPSPTPSQTPLNQQRNSCSKANDPRCYDCNNDHTINIFDFTCFRKFYEN